MYFSNIGNDELKQFHGKNGVDFTISLTNLISSNLFNVEEILSDKLYRVYPLFYCNNVISSNPTDKNFDNRCLILEKMEHETYLSFITNNDKSNSVLNENVLTLYDLNHNLSVNEFNAIIYKLRELSRLGGTLNFEDNLNPTGLYGTYELNDNDQLRNDTGFIINDKVKNNPLTITLKNPFFLNAKYTLTFTVKSLTGANVCIEEYEDYKTYDTFSIELIKDNPIALDLSGYVNDSVLDFNVDVSLSFDTSELANRSFGVELTAEEETIFVEDNVVLNAKLNGAGNLNGYTVQFFEDNVYCGSESTNVNGEAVFRHNTSLGEHTYTCKVLGLSANINVKVIKHTTEFVLSSNKNTAYIPTNFIISGVLTNENGVIPNASVKLYNNNVLLASNIITDNNGSFSKTINANSVSNYNFKAVFEETEINKYSQSNIVAVTARKLNTNLSINLNRNSIYYTETIVVSGVLKDELNNPIGNASIKLINSHGYDVASPTTTNSSGQYTFNVTLNAVGRYYLIVAYEGDGSHNSVQTGQNIVDVNKAPVNMTVSPNFFTYRPTENIQVSLSSAYGNFVASKITIDGMEISGNENTFNYTVRPQADSTMNISYGGSSNYKSVSKICAIDNFIKAINLRIEQAMLYITPSDNTYNPIQFYDLMGLELYFDDNLISVFPENSKTNSNGEYLISLVNIPTFNSIYVIYGDVRSNTVRN